MKPVCGICGDKLNSGKVTDIDCGGDCVACMAFEGDKEAISSLLGYIEELEDLCKEADTILNGQRPDWSKQYMTFLNKVWGRK
jgi:hypothetical protein